MHQFTLRDDIIDLMSKYRINKVERVLGNGNKEKAHKIIRENLQRLYEIGYSSRQIAKMFNKDKGTILNWVNYYNINTLNFVGLKKSIIKLSFDESDHDASNGYFKKINGKVYRVFAIYPNPLFAYVIGLILGDGHPSYRQVYITGGKTYDFLDEVYPEIKKFCKYLGDRTTWIEYYDDQGRRIEKEKSKDKTWRIFIQWSALAHFINNREFFIDSLKSMLEKDELFNAFTAGFFDADGCFVYRNNRPNRIGIDQSLKKWWFPVYYRKFLEKYNCNVNIRKREYNIPHRNKVSSGINISYVISLRMSSWPSFIDDVVLPYCKKPKHRERSVIFREQALKSRGRWKK